MPDVSDQKANVEHASSIDDAYRDPSKPSATGSPNAPNVVLEARRRGLQPPAIIAHLTPGERSELELRLRKKIDLRLLPMIILMYIMNYIDRNNIAAAKLANLEKDLGLPTGSTEYQTSVSILFVGYLLMQIPSNLFLNKIGKPAIYLPTCMIVWGTISAATAGVKNFGGLIAVRFFLGFVEAAYFPGCLYFLSCWYTRKELGLRTAMLYSGALISGAFSGLISAGITANMNGARGIAAWRWLFIIEGVATIGIAFIAYFILPNFPRTTSWLSEEEKALAIWRLEEDIGEDDWIDSQHQTFWSGAKSAFSDVKTYVLMVLLFCIVASGTVTNFFPTVVATLGYNSVNSLLLTAPPYVLCVITSFANAWHADRTGERYWHIILPLILNMVANIIAATTTSLAPRYLSMMLMVPGVYTGYVVALAWISNTLPRPPAKRAAGLAFINAVSNTSSIYASYMYPNSAGPRYIVAMSVNCCTSFVAICAATVLRFMLVRLNKKLDRGIHVEGAINALPGEAAQHGFRFKI
ncbi:putative Major facilitator superfamily (MFS) profile domain-containing protein [Seiridium unicorne]|uniref:Major facilitator superfamily (MFS) profile domain-containing protein n=1 Tax=Seiridium unicorne TaxID=138068 RepID=A0ABR2ULI0_9PEZI